MLKTTSTIALAATAAVFAANDTALAGAGVEPLTTERLISTGLQWPTYVTHAPGDYNRIYILEKQGRIQVYNLKTGVMSLFMDINGLVGNTSSFNDERGLLGLAFHPDYQNNSKFYVNYTNNSGSTTVREYLATSADLGNVASGRTLLTIAQPFSNHNGGWIDFGPNDGYLYIGSGDGGSANDPGNRGQDITNQLLGKMLRIDVDGNNSSNGQYGIPADNPFAGPTTGDDEIWAYGLRNPWRNSFDRETGDLYIADVGQNLWEEINFQAADSAGGENWGWRCREGAHNFIFGGSCGSETLLDPFQEYSHGGSPFRCSITGGYVYRGCAIPTLTGHYFYAEWCSDQIWSLVYDPDTGISNFADRTSELDPLFGNIGSIASFGEDANGEIYIVDHAGEIYRIIPETTTISIADFNCDGIVGFGDLTQLLGKWGPCVGCQEDLNGDDEVAFDDLTTLLGLWTPSK